MPHNLPHTIVRSGSFVFNRRVPRAVQADFGCEYVRIKLGRDEHKAGMLAEKLTRKLDQLWGSPVVRPMNPERLLEVVTPRIITLDRAVDIYLNNKRRGKGRSFEKDTRVAERVMLSVTGNKDIKEYDRDDARAVLGALRDTGVKTSTIRRRVNTLKAIFEHIYIEEEIERRNPFARLSIPGEGLDAQKRGTFTLAQLQGIYGEALTSRNEIKLIVPILGETGARLAEVVGLRSCDVDLEKETITITPHPARRLKTQGSERELPLVGAALEAMKLVVGMRTQEDDFLFPRYERDGTILATHASNAVNKWLKRVSGGLTCHCLRHTMRDRLRAVGAPLDLIDQIGGWSSVGSVGTEYRTGYATVRLNKTLSRVASNIQPVTPGNK